MIVVTKENLWEIHSHLMAQSYLAFDVESNGLRPYHGDRPFCFAIATDTEEFYFNFRDDHPHPLATMVFGGLDPVFLMDFTPLFEAKTITWFMHNAKFDMAMIKKAWGFEVLGDIHDTKTGSRLLFNDRLKHSLSECAKDIGAAKDTAVEDYIAEHVLWEYVTIPGKKQRRKKPFYDKVPYDLIAPYACKDVRVTYDLGMWQREQIRAISQFHADLGLPMLAQVHANETLLLKTVFAMEERGVKIDTDYCTKALAYETERMAAVEQKILEISGTKFANSPTCLKKLFAGEELVYGKPSKKTFKISAKFDTENIKLFKSPVAPLVIAWRDAKKRAEYYANFLYEADANSIVHASLNQDGTVTGRFSANSPNLTNLTKEDEEKDFTSDFRVRRAFVPRSAEYCFVMFDYDQMEYKLMLDIAGARGLIDAVNAGLDVHQATANDAGITRSEAKTTNFSVLYGAGIGLLASRLKRSVEGAKEIRDKIFAAAPEIYNFINGVQAAALRYQNLFNWYGRIYHFENPKLAYKGPNYLVQGGCADIMKIALRRIDNFLTGKKSKLVLCVHDEAVLECHRDELHLMPEIKRIMESVYVPQNGLAMSVGVEHSFINLADKTEGYPHLAEARDNFQEQPSCPVS
jgi:DNA polymerase-1